MEENIEGTCPLCGKDTKKVRLDILVLPCCFLDATVTGRWGAGVIHLPLLLS